MDVMKDPMDGINQNACEGQKKHSFFRWRGKNEGRVCVIGEEDVRSLTGKDEGSAPVMAEDR
jgi:hypothetical protein